MNVNPHFQYVQQQQQQQPQSNAPNGSSPQLSQIQMQQQRHLQQQRQQILNQHLQQQQQQQQTSHSGTASTLLAALNGGHNTQTSGSSVNGVSGVNFASGANPHMQLPQQVNQPRFGNPGLQHSQTQGQQSQQQAQQQPANQPQQGHLLQTQLQAQQNIPLIKEVWSFNLEREFNALRAFVNDKTSSVFISIHQEIPGIVARPVGTFKSSLDYHFQTLRSNSDLLNIIQLSFCAVKIRNGAVSNSVIWQFNFHYDLTKEMFNEEHLAMLSSTSQINFASHMSQGIPHFAFAELMMESGLLLDPAINWITYHSGYDLGFLISLLTNDILPSDESDFFWWCSKYFPSFYDLKHIGNQLLSSYSGGKVNPNALNRSSNNDYSGTNNSSNHGAAGSDLGKGITSNNKPSIEYLAEELRLLPISPVIRQYFTTSTSGQFAGHQQSQQMTSTLHAYLLMECFKEFFRQAQSDLKVFEKFKGYIWGLGDVLEGVKSHEAGNTKPKQDW